MQALLRCQKVVIEEPSLKEKRNFNSQVYLKKINTQEEGNYSLITSPL